MARGMAAPRWERGMGAGAAGLPSICFSPLSVTHYCSSKHDINSERQGNGCAEDRADTGGQAVHSLHHLQFQQTRVRASRSRHSSGMHSRSAAALSLHFGCLCDAFSCVLLFHFE